jgi:cytochrome c oxidase assembly protein subunit 15
MRGPMSDQTHELPRGAGDILAVGFGTTVAMWAVAYVARLPVVLAPAPVVLAGLLAVLVCGGYVAGRRGPRGVRGGVYSGALTGLLNLLVLGSFLSSGGQPNALVPNAGFWLPGSILFSGLLGGMGAWLALRRGAPPREEPHWTGALARVAVAATFLLLIAGGLVTGNQAGLAVADWPSSYGYNMFLYPFARMTGGIYYEHAHRLLGALVGLTTATLAIHLAKAETRAFVKRLGLAALALVIVQGTLGGLRVTEKNIDLAVIHGVTAQVFLSLLVAIAVVCTRTWRSDRPALPSGSAAADRRIASIAVVALLAQVVFGAIQRHLAVGLMLHVVFAFVVAALAIAAGARAWGFYPNEPVLKRAGMTVMHATGTQLVLGFGAWIARGAAASGAISIEWKVVVTTLHQGMGAILLASAVTLRLFLGRLLSEAD